MSLNTHPVDCPTPENSQCVLTDLCFSLANVKSRSVANISNDPTISPVHFGHIEQRVHSLGHSEQEGMLDR